MRENLIEFIDATLCNSRKPCPGWISSEPAQRIRGPGGPAGISFFCQDFLSIHGPVKHPNRQITDGETTDIDPSICLLSA
jgi:hypothetical protein